MGGPGSGRRPALVVNNPVKPQEAQYKKFIYPAVMIDQEWCGAIISSKQEPGKVAYTTCVLCELRPDEIQDMRVNVWMTQYEPTEEGLLGSVHSVPGIVEYISDEYKNGYALALVKLMDDVNYANVYDIYSPSTCETVEPLEEVYIATPSFYEGALYTFHPGIVSNITYPDGIRVTPNLTSGNKSGCIVVRRKPKAELLAILPRWQFWDLLEVGKLCLTT